jgi:hypothetical protein
MSRGLTQDLVNLNFLAPSVNPEMIRPVVGKLFNDYLNLKLGQIRFKDLAYELAEIIYRVPVHAAGPFHLHYAGDHDARGDGDRHGSRTLPSSMSPGPTRRSLCSVARGGSFAICCSAGSFMAKRGAIEWGKIWKLAKMALNWYVDSLRPKSRRVLIYRISGSGVPR